MWRLLGLLCVLSMALAGCDSASCAEGLSNLNGSCIDTTRCELECGRNQVCDFSTTPIGCKCASGFDGTPCGWVGVIANPGFADSPNTAWIDEGEGAGSGAEFLWNREGSEDLGEAVLREAVLCNGGGVSQQVEMPPFDASGPLVMRVVYQARGVDLGVAFDTAWKALPEYSAGWADSSFCLGEAAYGGERKLELGASERTAACFVAEEAEIRIDRVWIEPDEAGVCPLPGDVVNGDAEGAGGWVFDPTTGGDLSGEGREGSPAARIIRPTGSSVQATMTTRVSVPLPTDTEAPALSYFWRGTSGGLYQVDAGTYVEGAGRTRRPVDRLRGNNGEDDAGYCLPPWTYGTVVDLTFATIDDGLEVESELRVDDVEVFLDEDCRRSNALLDPGFESGEFFDWAGARLVGTVDQSISLRWNEAPAPLTGLGSLELLYANRNVNLRVENFVLIPEVAEGAAPPQLIFYSKVPQSPEAEVTWSLGAPPGESPREALPFGGTWQCNEVTLPEDWAGRWFRFQVEVRSVDDVDVKIPARSVQLDDFELTEEGCPPP